MESWARLMDNPPRGVAVLMTPWMSIFTWLTCIATAIVYTGMVFGKFADGSKAPRPVRSQKNALPLSSIFIIHAAFLAAIICFICWAFDQLGSFDFGPDLVAIQQGDRYPGGTGVFLGIAGLFSYSLLVLRHIERRWINLDTGPERHKIESDPLEDETAEDQ
jgi:hypothetical protein